jgi:tetratricopeptide (TPR) repeat protein
LARAKFAEGDFTAAEDLYRRASEAYPEYGAAWYGLATTRRRLGHDAESANNFKLGESYKDHNPPAEDELLNAVGKLATGVENRLARAKRLVGRGRFDEAAQLYKEVLKQYPDNPDCLVNLLDIAQYPNQASPEEVEALYTKARQVDPKLPEVYLYYGTALAAEGKYDAAVTAIGKAISLKPDNAEAHSWLADVRSTLLFGRPGWNGKGPAHSGPGPRSDSRVASRAPGRRFIYAGRADVPGAGVPYHRRPRKRQGISQTSPRPGAQERAAQSAGTD